MAAELQGGDDAVVQQRADELVFSVVIFCNAVSGSRLSSSLVSRRLRAVSAFLFNRTPNRWNGERLNSSGVCAVPQLIAARSNSEDAVHRCDLHVLGHTPSRS